ncbi:outer membrane protein assembly factor BamB [Methylocaldum sp.]|uniref:outer membrane protein assembly factor BamB n=1 Tax=Methylocaldum sp. TaxID=1969727 RepID=UPI002D6C3057|nr:outer membrane protein assembly factor BamB [Methylocaldum sp.]HYE34077.1 outer membrane protein assembly factor BamB [Methylocaldum sp.]
MRRFLILFLYSLLLTGCSGLGALKEAASGIGEYFGSSDNVDPPAELEDFEPAVKMTVLWDASVGKGYAKQYVNLVPAVTEDKVFAADRKGKVQARSRLNGDKLWSVDIELPVSAGPVAGESKLILGTSNAEVVALSDGDGSILWKTNVSSEILALPRVEGDTVVVRSSDGRITALDEKTGATRWYHDRTIPALSIRSRGSPTIADDLVLDGYGSGKLITLSLSDGKPEWEATVALPHGRSEIERLVDMDSDPIVKGDTIYVTGYQGGVAAVSLRDGEVQWRRTELSSYAGMAAARRTLFVTDASSDVWQLDIRSGADLWKQDELHQRRLTTPVLVKDYVVVGDLEGYLHLLSQEDGSLVGRVRVDKNPIEAAPVVFDDVIYVYTSGGTVAAVAVEGSSGRSPDDRLRLE